ncbi:MAG: ribose-phosphate pyrophosphokinase [Firmicutes bacterium]|nr:ribose-phosphate pyrophosphokinase [Bacillota bacterium]MCL1954248.1 ribose-phosphate pyrophosphokinase [Bacillota bacterium]
MKSEQKTNFKLELDKVVNKKIKLFVGNSNPKLAKRISKILGLDIGDMKVDSFSDGECSIELNESVRGCEVFVIQSLSNPVNQHLVELLVMIDALKRASAVKITAVIPYFGYARQDRKAKPRDPITAKLVANLIVTAGVDRVLTMDLHAAQIQGFFDIPVDHLYGIPVLRNHLIKLGFFENREVVIVSPDVGSVARCREFASKLGLPIAIVDKRRPKPNVSEVLNIIGDVRDKCCLIFDDMIDTAGTIVNAANALIDIGQAREIYACCTHGVLSGQALDKLNKSPISKLFLLDTIELHPEKLLPKFEQISTDDIFSTAIHHIFCNYSVSTI